MKKANEELVDLQKKFTNKKKLMKFQLDKLSKAKMKEENKKLKIKLN